MAKQAQQERPAILGSLNRFDVANPDSLEIVMNGRKVTVRVNGAVRFQAVYGEQAKVNVSLLMSPGAGDA